MPLNQKINFQKKNCHGTYCAIEIDEEGYLGSNDDGETNLFVIGMVHSYSMRGLKLLDHLEKYLIEGTAGFIDYDWPDCRVYRFWPDQKKGEVVLISPPANPAPLPEEKNG